MIIHFDCDQFSYKHFREGLKKKKLELLVKNEETALKKYINVIKMLMMVYGGLTRNVRGV